MKTLNRIEGIDVLFITSLWIRRIMGSISCGFACHTYPCRFFISIAQFAGKDWIDVAFSKLLFYDSGEGFEFIDFFSSSWMYVRVCLWCTLSQLGR